VHRLARRLRRHSHCNPSRAEQTRTEPNRTALVVRSSKDAPFIPLHISWPLNTFGSLRVDLDASCRVAVVVRNENAFVGSLSSRLVLCEILINTWRVVQGLATRLRGYSHCNPSRAEQNRTEPKRTAWVVRRFTEAPFIPLQVSWLPSPFLLLRVDHVVRNEHAFIGSLSSRRVLCEIRIK